MNEIQKAEIQFHEDTIEAIRDEDGHEYAVPKRICDNLGVDWKTQFRKLSADPFWGMVIMTMPSSGGVQETCVIPVNRVAAWLFTIKPSKVKPELAEKVRLYREECADVLDAYFRRGSAPVSTGLDPALATMAFQEMSRVLAKLSARVEKMEAKSLKHEDLECRLGPDPRYMSLRTFTNKTGLGVDFLPGERSSWGVKLTNHCKAHRIHYKIGKQNQYPEHVIGETFYAMMPDAIKRDKSAQLTLPGLFSRISN